MTQQYGYITYTYSSVAYFGLATLFNRQSLFTITPSYWYYFHRNTCQIIYYYNRLYIHKHTTVTCQLHFMFYCVVDIRNQEQIFAVYVKYLSRSRNGTRTSCISVKQPIAPARLPIRASVIVRIYTSGSHPPTTPSR